MANISSDAIDIKLQFSAEGVEAALKELGRVNSAAINATNTSRAEAEQIKIRQQAEAVMNRYASATYTASVHTAQLANWMKAGTISSEEYSRSINDINNRMAQMSGGAGRMGFMVGNLATGMEDFITVISMTGFGMEGFSAATRSASNNIGQAVRALGTGTAAMLAPIVSIGVVLAGFAIPQIYRWVTGAKDAASETVKWTNELEKLKRMLSVASDEMQMQLDLEIKVRDINKDMNVNHLLDREQKIKDSIKQFNVDTAKTQSGMTAEGLNAFNSVMPGVLDNQFNKIANYLGESLGGDVETKIRERMKKIKETFITEVGTVGGEEAKENYIRNMKSLKESMLSNISKLNEGERKLLYPMIMDFGNQSVDQINAAAKEIDKITKSGQVKLSEIADKIKLANEEMKAVIEQQEKAIKAERQKYNDERFTEIALAEQKKQDEVESLNIQVKKNKLLGDQNEAERKILDLALRKKELDDMALAPFVDPNQIFNEELKAIADDIEKKILKLNEVTVKNDSASQVEAYTAANRMMFEAASKDNTELKEMVQLLTAIRDQQAGKPVFNMEFR